MQDTSTRLAEPANVLGTRRFVPLLVTQTLAAFNGGLTRNAAAVLMLFSGWTHGAAFVALSGAVFVLPYLFFSSLAGEIADRYDKSALIRISKTVELLLMVAATLALVGRSAALQILVLFGLGLLATLFTAIKYAILPDHLPERQLIAGNGLIEAGTFLGILGGTIAGAALVLEPAGDWIVGCVGVAAAAIGLAVAILIPATPAGAPGLRISWNLAAGTLAILRQAWSVRAVRLSILGLSWFWGVGAIVLAELTVATKEAIGGSAGVATLLLTVFSVGLGAGSVLCSRLLKGELSPRHVPFAAFGVSIFAWDFATVCKSIALTQSFATIGAVLASLSGWRALVDLLLLGACGGLFSVPLNALIQARSEPASRSRTIAAGNVVNAIFMVLGASLAATLSALGVSALRILLLTALANLAVAIWILRILPRETIRALARWYFVVFHRAKLTGLEHYEAAGPRAVIVVNHLSLLDGGLVAGFLPDAPAFAIYWTWLQKWWLKPFLLAFDALAVDPNSPYSARDMVRWVRQNRKLVVFPEGRISTTGALMKVYDGAASVAEWADAVVVPVHIDGLQFTPFSRMRGKQRLRWFPQVRMNILPPRRIVLETKLYGRARRHALGDRLHEIMVDAAFASRPPEGSLFSALLKARERYGETTELAEDIAREPLTYGNLVRGAAILGRILDERVPGSDRIGVMLPNSTTTLTAFFGLQAFGRVPVLLNYSVGSEIMLSACRTARLSFVLTSREFVARARLQNTVSKMAGVVQLIWLEDLRSEIGLVRKLRGIIDACWARHLPGTHVKPDAPAVILFTSGSEGLPKGVVLSHRNILANCAQMAAVLDFNPADRVLNSLPMFHSFGLTVATILPALSGVHSFLYPSPLHYRIVPDAIYDSEATIMFGTDTFLRGWGRFAHPYDFHSVRYVFAGAERLRDETRELYSTRFGLRIYEGYGITETGPALASNTPIHYRAGTVGRLLPGIEAKLEELPGVADGGRLLVRGPNVMLGYIRPGGDGKLEPPPGGWFDTGDIVSIDGEGFVTIRGRAKRFAKVAGEMVSMTAVEELAGALWPTATHAVVSQPDAAKGERLILVTSQAGADPHALLTHGRTRGVTELMIPRDIRVVAQIPLLGTGKIDYLAVQRLVAEQSDAIVAS